jgi:hypothetical protein
MQLRKKKVEKGNKKWRIEKEHRRELNAEKG